MWGCGCDAAVGVVGTGASRFCFVVVLRYHSLYCPLPVSCPLFGLNLLILVSLLPLTHSFDLHTNTTHTRTHPHTARHEYSSVCLPKSYSLSVYSVALKTELEDGPIYVCVCACMRACMCAQ